MKKIAAALAILFLVAACEYKYPDLNVGGGNDSPQVDAPKAE